MPVSQPTIPRLEEFLFGHARCPVTCGNHLEIGAGTVIPEVNFTLQAIEICPENWADIREQYSLMIEDLCRRAVELEVPGILFEFETLPPMTVNPAWGLEITEILSETIDRFHQSHGLRAALRLTPNDTRDHRRPPRMRSGPFWEGMVEFLHKAPHAGADLLAIESTGGKEVSDEGLMNADLKKVVFALGVLAPRDMEYLWGEILSACEGTDTVPSGDTACGFANTAMVLADRNMLPKVFAAVIRVASVPRDLVAYRVGARGPSKDCAYEGPYLKALAGVPISMEGRTAACAHLSHVGNIAQAVCDCWSNESVQKVRLLSADAPTVSLEQLAYDCRLMNVAGQSREDARKLRDWLVESDSALDPQAYVLRPDVVLRIASEIAREPTPYLQTRRAARAALREINRAFEEGRLRIPDRERRWLERLAKEAEELPDREEDLIAECLPETSRETFLPEEYGLS
ncbi:MAG: hypothetical protein GHCLOJNM_03124 [bacterium]|nr:hypothetical protein [bacterium]